MPELPEVETTVRALRVPLVGETITGVRNSWPRHIATPSPEALRERIAGRRIEAIDRRGKYLVFTLTGGETLIIHLRMTGHLSVVEADAPVAPHTHTTFTLANGKEMRFRNPRKFGRVYLVRDPEDVLGKLGPEPLDPDFTPERLKEQLERRTKQLKALLLDQTFIAGVGNIYADEALFYAGLHPQRGAHSLRDGEIKDLHAALQKVLRMGIERKGASIDRYVKPDGSRGTMQDVVAVYKRTGEACVRCGTTIERIVVAGRSTHFCPACQPLETEA
ncbi:MAG: bifunctional DNA-formamidopyrimidine glycosylase/DNA-(apurinic or apyrimidinic site) lyase [Candidatus Promineifilaceae bacterium]|nr:bifunctional DNA-formamidopyrimidine glycosylase/DNA-(apurinic or apyrimidinic site) lyase [Candidatus Promineifilaceae bacterium]